MSPRALKDQASRLHATRKFAAAAALWEALIADSPGDPRLYLRHAEACTRAGRRAQAADSFLRAARTYVGRLRYAEARAVLIAALRELPEHANLLDELGRLAAPSATPSAAALFPRFPQPTDAQPITVEIDVSDLDEPESQAQEFQRNQETRAFFLALTYPPR